MMFNKKNQCNVNIHVAIPSDLFTSFNSQGKDAIQIGIKIPENCTKKDVHFIQFITRQMPNMYEFTQSNKLCWEDADTYYMKDLKTPKWRTDSAGCPCPYYEDKGAHEEKEGWVYIYDQPGLNEDEERVIGCTFLIANETVFKEIRWSRQYETNENKELNLTYKFTKHKAEKLPDWAILTLKNEYDTNQANYEEKKIYEIPKYLDREIKVDKEEALLLAKKSVITCPENWLTIKDERFKELFIENKQEIIESKGSNTSFGFNQNEQN